MSARLETTHIVTENELVVYRRERSSIWQCRYKVDGVWQRASTKEWQLIGEAHYGHGSVLNYTEMTD
jgi:hypothetical protein